MGAIAAFTFKEALRRRLVLAGAVLTAGFLVLFGFITHALVNQTANDPLIAAAGHVAGAMVGVYLARSFSGLLAILVAVGAISSELESGAIQSVLVRPIPRSMVVLGRFVGYGGMLVLYTLCLQGLVLLLAHVIGGSNIAHPLAVLGLLCLEPLMLLGLTLLGSTVLPTLANGAAAVLLYGAAVIGGFLKQLTAFGAPMALAHIGLVTSLLLPADAVYRKAFAVASRPVASAVLQRFMGPLGAAVPPGWWLVFYGVCYIVAMVALASWSLSRRNA